MSSSLTLSIPLQLQEKPRSDGGRNGEWMGTVYFGHLADDQKQYKTPNVALSQSTLRSTLNSVVNLTASQQWGN